MAKQLWCRWGYIRLLLWIAGWARSLLMTLIKPTYEKKFFDWEPLIDTSCGGPGLSYWFMGPGVYPASHAS